MRSLWYQSKLQKFVIVRFPDEKKLPTIVSHLRTPSLIVTEIKGKHWKVNRSPIAASTSSCVDDPNKTSISTKISFRSSSTILPSQPLALLYVTPSWNEFGIPAKKLRRRVSQSWLLPLFQSWRCLCSGARRSCRR